MAQFARPDADLSVGAWGAAPLWSKLDDNSDADFIAAPDGTDNVTCDLGLTDIVDPRSSSGHVLRWRRRVDAGSQVQLVVELRQGAAAIVTRTEAGLSNTAFATSSYTLSAAEADAITDYTDLRVRLIASDFGALNLDHAEVAWVELEVPDIPAPKLGTLGAMGVGK